MSEPVQAIRQYYAQHQNLIRYITIEISHPSIVTKRFVRDQVEDKTFTIDGVPTVFQPLQFQVPRPSQREREQSSLTVKLGRVGSEVLAELRKIDGFNWIEPASMSYREIFPGGEIKQFDFSVSDIRISLNSVNVVCTDDNPSNYRVAVPYTIGQFPGLETV